MEFKQYQYLPIQSAVTCINQKVNIYGVIKEYEQPKASKGSDMVSIMTIMDMSYHSPGLRLIIFSSDVNTPHVKAIGDIIRLHHVKIEPHNNEINAVARKKYSYFVLFEGKGGSSYNPYQSSREDCKVMGLDEKMISSLRSWLETFPIETGKSDYTVQIRGIKEGVYFDLFCKVLFAHEISENSSVIYVWDGTDASPQEFEMKQEEEMDFDVDPLKELSVVLPRTVLCYFPTVGTILRVFIEMPINELQQRLPEFGNWVKLRNMTCRTQSGLWEGVVIHTSKVYILSSQTQERYEMDSAQRLKTESARLPQWCPETLDHITVTNCDGIRLSTLMDVITHSQATYKFRCLVRVIASLPWNVEEFCGERNNSKDNIDYFYRVRLTLEDPTARIHAYLYGEDANNFFKGYPATSIKSSSTSLDALKTKVYKLLGANEGEKPCGIRNPPWVECCVKSYYLDKKCPWDSRRYRIFGTELRG